MNNKISLPYFIDSDFHFYHIFVKLIDKQHNNDFQINLNYCLIGQFNFVAMCLEVSISSVGDSRR